MTFVLFFDGTNFQVLLHWIVPSPVPRIASENPSGSLKNPDNHSPFLHRLDHIIAARRSMLAVRRSIHCPSPDRLVGGKILLIETNESNKKTRKHLREVKQKPRFCGTLFYFTNSTTFLNTFGWLMARLERAFRSMPTCFL